MFEHRIFASLAGQWLAAAIPLLLLIAGGFEVWREWRFGRQARATWGTVVDLSTRHDGLREGHVYHPIVQFELERTHVQVTFEATAGSHPPFWQIGDRVPILYNPDQPRHARINSFTQRWFLPCLLVVSAMLTLLWFWGLALR